MKMHSRQRIPLRVQCGGHKIINSAALPDEFKNESIPSLLSITSEAWFKLGTESCNSGNKQEVKCGHVAD